MSNLTGCHEEKLKLEKYDSPTKTQFGNLIYSVEAQSHVKFAFVFTKHIRLPETNLCNVTFHQLLPKMSLYSLSLTLHEDNTLGKETHGERLPEHKPWLMNHSLVTGKRVFDVRLSSEKTSSWVLFMEEMKSIIRSV